MKTILHAIALCCFLAAALMPSHAQAHDDKEQIVMMLKGMFEKPDSPLGVAPVVVVGDNAIAGWVQGDKGGRALLWRKDGKWQLRLCSGDGLKNAEMLVNAMISAADAKAMVDQLTKEEAAMDPKAVAKFSLFEGTMVMDGSTGQQQ